MSRMKEGKEKKKERDKRAEINKSAQHRISAGGESDLQLYAMIRIDIASRAWTVRKARNADYGLCYGDLDLG